MNIQQLLFGDATRVRHVVRFGNCQRSKDETVAEHSFFVAYYALVMAEELKFNELQIAELLRRAIVHDLEESISGDFPRPFKYSSPKLREMLEEAGKEAFALAMRETVTVNVFTRLQKSWASAKDGSPVGRVLAFADFLAVLSYLCLEHAARNQTVHQHLDEMKGYFNRFSGEEYTFLSPWISEAGAILARIMM